MGGRRIRLKCQIRISQLCIEYMYTFLYFKLTLLWRYIVIKGKQVLDDSVPRCLFTGLPGPNKDKVIGTHRKLTNGYKRKSQDIRTKTKKDTRVQYTTHIHEPYNGKSLYFSSACFMAACNPLTPVKRLYPKNTLLASP